MVRLLCTLGLLASGAGLAAGVSSGLNAAPERAVAVVGDKRPLFLGTQVVTASALPPTAS